MRVANWPDVLHAKIEEWRTRPFDWNGSCCTDFAADVVLALTGTDYRERFPAFATEEEAAAILAAHGGMVGLVISVMGEPKPVAWAKRGDLAAGDFGRGIAVGICAGVYFLAPGAKGLLACQMSKAIAAWDV